MTRQRHVKLGLSIGSVGYHPAAWRLPEASRDGGLSARHYIESAQLAERGRFDFAVVPDVAAVGEVDDRRPGREQGALKLEPSVALAAAAAVTERVGLIPSVSTTYGPPYAVARRMASLDHISRGRAGWNVVTGWSDDEARNFQLDAPPSAAVRQARALEFVGVVKGLWDSWDDDAFIRDKASGIYFERDRFHFLEHRGEYFEVRGPLDTARPLQGSLPIITAGASPQARDLAVRFADMVYVRHPNIDAARRYYGSIKQQLAVSGRDRDSLTVMSGILPFVGRTHQEAEDRFARLQGLLDPRDGAGMLPIGYDMDVSVTELTMTGDASADEMRASARESTFGRVSTEAAWQSKPTATELNEVVSQEVCSLCVIGTPARIADVMEEWFSTRATDGFIVQPSDLPRSGADFVDLVIPELQRRGLFRTEYAGRTLRDHLGLPWVASRYDRRPRIDGS
jgi:N-acetyl-S-(2-succino)cysteine monooxygenase